MNSAKGIRRQNNEYRGELLASHSPYILGQYSVSFSSAN